MTEINVQFRTHDGGGVLHLPITEDELYRNLDPNGDYEIIDIESDLSIDLLKHGMKIEELNDLANEMTDDVEENIKLLEKFADEMGHTLYDTVQAAYNGELTLYESTNLEDLGREINEEIPDWLQLTERASYYFDFEDFASDVKIEWDIVEIEGRYIQWNY